MAVMNTRESWGWPARLLHWAIAGIILFQLGVGYYYYGQPDITAVWIAPEDPTLLRLRTNIGARCRAAISGTVASGVMLVYTNGERPTEPNDPPPGSQLLDEHGEPLADIGPAWAIDELDACFVSPNCYYVSDLATGHLPELVSLAQIPCP